MTGIVQRQQARLCTLCHAISLAHDHLAAADMHGHFFNGGESGFGSDLGRGGVIGDVLLSQRQSCFEDPGAQASRRAERCLSSFSPHHSPRPSNVDDGVKME